MMINYENVYDTYVRGILPQRRGQIEENYLLLSHSSNSSEKISEMI